MLTMQDIQALAAANAGAFTTAIEPFTIGGRTFETDNEPLIMGVVNRSWDSTYRDSVAPTPADAVRRARILFHQGAHVIDVGAESSRAGGLRVSTHDQIDALIPVVEELSADHVPVSIESYDTDV
ncbi:MAG: dihydropteroate synthase, partial [Actinomycetota bacterium]|nr:dihydropteroate synthase [Actinomycetota bacterium]